MNRRGLLGMVLALPAAAAGAAAAGAAAPPSSFPRWEDLTEKERLQFEALCQNAWDSAQQRTVEASYPWRRIGWRWNKNPDGTLSPEYFNELIPADKFYEDVPSD